MINGKRTNMYSSCPPGFASEREYGIHDRAIGTKKDDQRDDRDDNRIKHRRFLYSKTEISKMATLNYIQGNFNYEESQANYLKKSASYVSHFVNRAASTML